MGLKAPITKDGNTSVQGRRRSRALRRAVADAELAAECGDVVEAVRAFSDLRLDPPGVRGLGVSLILDDARRRRAASRRSGRPRGAARAAAGPAAGNGRPRRRPPNGRPPRDHRLRNGRLHNEHPCARGRATTARNRRPEPGPRRRRAGLPGSGKSTSSGATSRRSASSGAASTC